MVGGGAPAQSCARLVSSMTKSDARKKLDSIIGEVTQTGNAVAPNMSMGQFINNVYYPFYTRKWKRSTAGNNINRVDTHVVREFGDRKVKEFRRDDLQKFLDGKAMTLSFSMVETGETPASPYVHPLICSATFFILAAPMRTELLILQGGWDE